MTDKIDVYSVLLRRGHIFIHLNPKKPNVHIPPYLYNQDQVVLEVGLNMPIPIPDLRADDFGIRGTLSFRGSPFSCSVPWDAIFALVGQDNLGKTWYDELPQSLKDKIALEDQKVVRLDPSKPRKNIPPQKSAKKRSSHLRLIK